MYVWLDQDPNYLTLLEYHVKKIKAKIKKIFPAGKELTAFKENLAGDKIPLVGS